MRLDAPYLPAEKPGKRTLAIFLLVAAAHVLAWKWISSEPGKQAAMRLLNSVEVTLLAPPVPEAAPTAPPRPEPVKPAIKPQVIPARQPIATPQTTAATESAMLPRETAAATAPAISSVAAAEPSQPMATAAESVVEPPRYNAAYLNNPPPAYPLAARRRGVEGSVLLRAEVQPDGRCSRTELKQSSGSSLLDQAAQQAVLNWRFVPARRGSQAIVAWVEIPVTFKLEN